MNTQAENLAFDLVRAGVPADALAQPMTWQTVGPILDEVGKARGGSQDKPFGCSLMAFIRRVSREELTNPECGSCNACCRMGYAINGRPEDKDTLPWVIRSDGMKHLPVANGACGLLKETGCSIYGDRPKACRLYDCRTVAVSFAMSSAEDDLKNTAFKQWSLASAIRTPDDATALLGVTAVQMAARTKAQAAGVGPETLARYAIRFYLKYRREIDPTVAASGQTLPEFLVRAKAVGGLPLQEDIDAAMAAEKSLHG
jgi:hypothetical protein